MSVSLRVQKMQRSKLAYRAEATDVNAELDIGRIHPRVGLGPVHWWTMQKINESGLRIAFMFTYAWLLYFVV